MLDRMNRHLTGAPSTVRWHSAFAIIIVIACLLAYGVSLNGPLFFDDVPNLTDNRLLKIDGADFDDWRAAAISSDSGVLHRPVAMLTFAANYVVSGEFSPISLKGTNLAIHLLVGLLLYFLFLTFLQTPAMAALNDRESQLIALVATGFWLLHPLHVSTVLYAIQRMAQLSTLFCVLGLLVYGRYRLRWAHSGGSVGELMAAGIWLALLIALAVLSKENGALLPWLILVVEVSLFRGTWNGQRHAALLRFSWNMVVLPVLLVALVLLFFPETIVSKYSGREFSLTERLLTEGRVLWQYLGWILLPDITAMGFFHDDIALSRDWFSPYTTVVALLAWVAVTATAVLLRKRYPLLLFALFFYLVAHSMESTILPLELVFEHRNYLPSIGVCLLAAWLSYQIAARFAGLRYQLVVSIVLVVLFAQLLIRTSAWTDETTLARYNAVNHPMSPRANFFYGNVLFEQFASAEALGLDAEEQKILAVNSRAYFARMHALDKRSFAPLVMLYQLDSLHFPALAKEKDWLGKLETLAGTKRMHAIDKTAVSVLVDFSLSDSRVVDRARVSFLLDSLVARYPNDTNLVSLQYRQKLAEPGYDREELRAMLQSAAGRKASNRQLYALLIQEYGADDVALAYESAREWMKQDTPRRELSVIRRIFDH